MLYIDSGWSGLHGIGRFAREVCTRLDVEHRPLPARGSPSSPRDVVSSRRLALRAGDSVWSPGYNVGLTRAAQIPTVHDLIHLQDPQQSTLPKRLYYESVLKPAIRRSKLVFTVSETSRVHIEQWIADPTVDIVTVGNGTSSAFLTGQVRRPRTSTFVIVGTSKPHKNVLVALRALALRPDYLVRVVTADVEAVASLVTSVGVTKQVTILSGLSDEQLADEYSRATALLFPSLVEGFGLPALEAMQCGCPVIYWSGCGSVAEIAAGRGTGVESAHDENEWARAMDRAVDALDRPLDMPQQWRRLYDWDEVARKVSSVLRESVSHREGAQR